MENYSFWKKQTKEHPLFPDIKWNQPERLDQAGKIGLVGGNKFGFIGLSFAYNTIVDYKIIKLKLLLPNSLKNIIPISSPDITFTDSNISGGFSKNQLLILMPYLTGQMSYYSSAIMAKTVRLLYSILTLFKITIRK